MYARACSPVTRDLLGEWQFLLLTPVNSKDLILQLCDNLSNAFWQSIHAIHKFFFLLLLCVILLLHPFDSLQHPCCSFGTMFYHQYTFAYVCLLQTNEFVCCRQTTYRSANLWGFNSWVLPSSSSPPPPPPLLLLLLPSPTVTGLLPWS